LIRATLERTASWGSVWYVAAKANILASQHFANLHRIKLPLHSIFFQYSSFFMGNKMDTGRQAQYYCSGLTLSCQYALKIFLKALFHTTSTSFLSHGLKLHVSQLYSWEGRQYVCIRYSADISFRQLPMFSHLWLCTCATTTALFCLTDLVFWKCCEDIVVNTVV